MTIYDCVILRNFENVLGLTEAEHQAHIAAVADFEVIGHKSASEKILSANIQETYFMIDYNTFVTHISGWAAVKYIESGNRYELILQI